MITCPNGCGPMNVYAMDEEMGEASWYVWICEQCGHKEILP
jgi:hypothetical protein